MLPSVLSLSCSAAAWDTVEELSAAASHAKASGSGDPLEDVSGALAGTSSTSSSSVSRTFAWRSQLGSLEKSSTLICMGQAAMMDAVGFICRVCQTSGRSPAAPAPVFHRPTSVPPFLLPLSQKRVDECEADPSTPECRVYDD
jgi:hypothetical protein